MSILYHLPALAGAMDMTGLLSLEVQRVHEEVDSISS